MKKLILVLPVVLALASCKKEGCTDEAANNYNGDAKKDDGTCTYDPVAPTTSDLTLNISGLEDLGSGYTYETWIMVNGTPVSIGTFDVDATGQLSQTTFTGDATDVSSATAFVLSIEPVPDADPAPSDVKILGGDFVSNSAPLSIAHGAALGNDLTGATGNFIIATPTTNDMSDSLSGVWFFDPTAAMGSQAMDLPTLPTGWVYEGWAVINGTPVSTGRFSDPAMSDLLAPFSGTDNPAPAFPGEDFAINAPTGMMFPLDLSGTTMVISVEPEPDNSVAPFALKPLTAMVPAMALSATPYALVNGGGATNPTGTASR